MTITIQGSLTSADSVFHWPYPRRTCSERGGLGAGTHRRACKRKSWSFGGRAASLAADVEGGLSRGNAEAPYEQHLTAEMAALRSERLAQKSERAVGGLV
jgi:hypothetical protein